jgi:hypothetical protein
MGKIRVTALSDLFLCSTRWVHDLVSRKILPKATKGLFDQDECTRKYVSFLKSGLSKDGEYEALKAALMRARVEKLQLEKEIQQGKLVPKEKFQDLMNQAGSDFEQAYRAISWKLASVLVRVKDAYGKDADDEKICAVLVDRMVTDLIREVFYRIPKGTPMVHPSEWELVKVGAISPDPDGYVLFCGLGRKVKMKVVDVIRQGEEAVAKMERMKGESS